MVNYKVGVRRKRTRLRKRKIKKGGEGRDEQIYLSQEDINALTSVIQQIYGSDRDKDLVISKLYEIKYSPNYECPFGPIRPDEPGAEKYAQAMCKIQYYFREGRDIDELIGNESIDGGKRRSKKRTYKRKTYKRRRNR